jgi:hypothetical protein
MESNLREADRYIGNDVHGFINGREEVLFGSWVMASRY